MSGADYYPAGAYSDPDAPYNQVDIPEKEFDVTISQSLSREVTVSTNDYEPVFDDENGCTHADTRNTDWDKAYKENRHLNPIEIIMLFRETLERQLPNVDSVAAETNQDKKLIEKGLKYLISECEGWISDETTIMEA